MNSKIALIIVIALLVVLFVPSVEVEAVEEAPLMVDERSLAGDVTKIAINDEGVVAVSSFNYTDGDSYISRFNYIGEESRVTFENKTIYSIKFKDTDPDMLGVVGLFGLLAA